MTCRICSIPNPGNHLRENCCRPCAAFFKRTINLRIRYKCKQYGDCKVTQGNRFFCKFCRMKRCIDAGMTNPENPYDTLEFYLDDSPSMLEVCRTFKKSSFKDRLPSLSDEDVSSEECVFANYDKFVEECEENVFSTFSKATVSTELPIHISLLKQASLAYEKHKLKWPNCSKDNIFTSGGMDLGTFVYNNTKEVVNIAEFCMEISAFSKLKMDQKRLLLDNFVARFIHFDRAFVTIELLGCDISDSRTVYFNGHAADLRKVRLNASKISEDKEHELISMILEKYNVVVDYMIQMKKMNPDEYELMYMIIASLWNVEGIFGISPETYKIAIAEQDRLCGELAHYYKLVKRISNYASRIYKMKNIFHILNRIDCIRREDNIIASTFDMLNFEVDYNCTALVC